jgi:hypothetical protein
MVGNSICNNSTSIGNENVFLGYQVSLNGNGYSSCVALGKDALNSQTLTTGTSGVIAIGHQAGLSGLSSYGIEAVIIGKSAGYLPPIPSSGDHFIAIGAFANNNNGGSGTYQIGNDSIAIGYRAGTYNNYNTGNNSVCIGKYSTCITNNGIVIATGANSTPNYARVWLSDTSPIYTSSQSVNIGSNSYGNANDVLVGHGLSTNAGSFAVTNTMVGSSSSVNGQGNVFIGTQNSSGSATSSVNICCGYNNVISSSGSTLNCTIVGNNCTTDASMSGCVLLGESVYATIPYSFNIGVCPAVRRDNSLGMTFADRYFGSCMGSLTTSDISGTGLLQFSVPLSTAIFIPTSIMAVNINASSSCTVTFTVGVTSAQTRYLTTSGSNVYATKQFLNFPLNAGIMTGSISTDALCVNVTAFSGSGQLRVTIFGQYYTTE